MKKMKKININVKKLKTGKKAKTTEVTTISQHIKESNSIVLKILIFMIVFAIANFVMSACFSGTMRKMSKNSSGVVTARNHVNEWVTDLIISITEGSEFTNVTSLDGCEFSKWKIGFDVSDMKDKSVKAAFEKAVELHDEIHLTYKNNFNVTIQTQPEKALDLINLITAKYEEFSDNIDIVTAYYAKQEDNSYMATLLQVIVAIVLSVIITFIATKLINKNAHKLGKKITEPVDMVAKWAELTWRFL